VFKKNFTSLPSPAADPTPTAFPNSLFGLVLNEEALISFQADNVNYRLAVDLIDNPDSTSIGINEGLKNDSNKIMQDKGCTSLTSGGFYQEDGSPIGWLVSNSLEVSDWQNNRLFNGYLGVLDHEFVVSKGSPGTLDYSWGIQAGPILIENGSPLSLSLQRDQQARRLVAGITKEKKLILLMVVSGDSLFAGPSLTDLPRVLESAGKVIGQEFETAINLDGGTASSFLSTKVSLKELKPIGSYLCVK